MVRKCASDRVFASSLYRYHHTLSRRSGIAGFRKAFRLGTPMFGARWGDLRREWRLAMGVCGRAAALRRRPCRARGAPPPGTPRRGRWGCWWSGGAWVLRCGGWQGCGGAGLLGVWVIGEAVFWQPPHAALYGGMGELSVFGRWAPPHRCGSWLRPELVPPIGSSPGRMRVWFLLFCPSSFWSLWAGNQVTGVTGDRGYRGWGDAIRLKNAPDRLLTRRRGRCPRTPARDSSPLDPRQGGMAPLGTAILAGAESKQRPKTVQRR